MTSKQAKKIESQFIAAYDEHGEAIFRYCYYRVFSRELARDLTQEAFLKTWKSLSEGSEVENLRAWLYRVAKNLVIDHTRRRHEFSLDELHEQGFEPAVNHEEALMAGIDARAALAELSQLDDIYREALLLRYVDGFSPREIAEFIDETPNVVSVRINRGLKQLRAMVTKSKKAPLVPAV